MKTRLAPTPSGYIHLGNAFNFYLTWTLAKEAGGTVFLRIDDFDFDRSRREYIQDVFDSLAWLEIKPDAGPKNLEDFLNNFSQRHRQAAYWRAVEILREKNLTYACECSRSQTDRFTQSGAYRGHCRDKKINFVRGKHSLRLRCEDKMPGDADWTKTLHDFVLWTKEDRAAYQLVSVVEDTEMKIDFIVRGEDLRDSSGAQKYLAEKLGGDFARIFSRISFRHHPLLAGGDSPDKKLSKSLNALSLRELVNAGKYSRARFLKEFEEFLIKCENEGSL